MAKQSKSPRKSVKVKAWAYVNRYGVMHIRYLSSSKSEVEADYEHLLPHYGKPIPVLITPTRSRDNGK